MLCVGRSASLPVWTPSVAFSPMWELELSAGVWIGAVADSRVAVRGSVGAAVVAATA